LNATTGMSTCGTRRGAAGSVLAVAMDPDY
jgi:hypothetical protein